MNNRKDDEEEDQHAEMDMASDYDPEMPPQMSEAPTWAVYLFNEQRRDRKSARNRDLLLDRRLFRLERTVAGVDSRLGAESPNGDGGTGFIGEVRRATSDIDALKGERNFVRGAIAAITAAGTLLIYGFSMWLKNIATTIGIHK